MKKEVISIINNTLIVIFVTFATICMFYGIHFMPNVITLDSKGLSCLKFFTVDSNLLVGLTSFLFVIYEILLLKKKIKKIPTWLYILKHVGATSIALTFFTTLLYLGPTINTGFLSLYTNANLFFHAIIPILAMVGYVFLDKYDNKYKYCLYSLIPFILYAVYYAVNVLTHLDNGKTSMAYDFYGFFHGNPNTIFVFFPIILIVVYTLATILYYLNNKLLKK